MTTGLWISDAYKLLTLSAFRCEHSSICLSGMAPTLSFHAELKAPASAPVAEILRANCEPWSSQRGRLADFHRSDHPVRRAVQYLLPGDSQVGVNVRPRNPHLLGPFCIGPGMSPDLLFLNF